MRRSSVWCAGAVALAVGASACASTASETQDVAPAATAEIRTSSSGDLKLYDANGVRFEFPAEWDRGEVDNPREARFSVGVGYPGSINFVSVRAFEVPPSRTTPRLIKRHLRGIEEFERATIAEDGGRVLGRVKPLTVAGLPGYAYRALYPDNQMTRRISFFDSDDKFAIECSWDAADPLDGERGCAQVLRSFTVYE